MSVDRAPVQSYQRIFRPERRIYQIEGYRLPVPGGVPLCWLGYALGGLIAVIALSGRSTLIVASVTVGAGIVGALVGGRLTAVIAAGGSLVATYVLGVLLSTLDWPLRLVIVPALLATIATRATPDGRAAHRYAASWVAMQLRPQRRSLGRALPMAGHRRCLDAALWVAPGCRGRCIHRARVFGPASVQFAVPVQIRDGCGWFGHRRSARLRRPHRVWWWGDAAQVSSVDLTVNERLELRP